MKKAFQEPEIQIMVFSVEDVITVSGPEPEEGSGDGAGNNTGVLG